MSQAIDPIPTVVVTGATSGIGLAVAEALAATGVLVIGASIDARVGESEQRWEAGRVVQLAVDVRSEASVIELFARLDQHGVRLTGLVNSAGIGVFKPALELSADEVDSVYRTNVLGSFLCMREAARRMVASGGGRIVNLGSISAKVALANNGAYAPTKAAMRSLGEVFNEELKGSGVHVTYLCLGAVYTPIWHGRPGFSEVDMLACRDVAAAVSYVMSQPPHVRVDEMTIVPPKGVL